MNSLTRRSAGKRRRHRKRAGSGSSGLEQFPTERRLLELHDALRRALSKKRILRGESASAAKKKSTLPRLRTGYGASLAKRASADSGRSAAHLCGSRQPAREPRQSAGSGTEGFVAGREAQSHEASRNYDRAIRSWAAIADLGIAHPDVENSIARLRKLQDQARATKKADRIRSIRESLGTFDLNGANSLLADALREFSGDTQLTELAATATPSSSSGKRGFRCSARPRASSRHSGGREAPN